MNSYTKMAAKFKMAAFGIKDKVFCDSLEFYVNFKTISIVLSEQLCAMCNHDINDMM